ncbi:MAG: heat-shock protein Hsp20 [Beggiatoa sp. IS2]|nr:MAG: heat-shock protein Hsp20 [Beggiatoa sp. IS2]
MNVTRYEPMGLLTQFHKDIERFLGMGHENSDSTIATSAWTPAVDIKEEAERFLIEADIPGVDPQDIEISMGAGVLTIKGERKVQQPEQGRGYKRVERAHGTFHRRFSLPDTADAEGVTASGKDGVLQISIPKKPVDQPIKIVVR